MQAFEKMQAKGKIDVIHQSLKSIYRLRSCQSLAWTLQFSVTRPLHLRQASTDHEMVSKRILRR